jgi:hypothetical protein
MRILKTLPIELMKIYAEEKNFSQAEKFANEVLKYSKNSAAVLEQAKVICKKFDESRQR